MNLNLVLEAFEKASSEESDDHELISVVIDALERHQWNADLAAISMIIFVSDELEDGQKELVLNLLEQKAKGLVGANVSSSQKPDLIVKCLERANPDHINIELFKKIIAQNDLNRLVFN